MCTKNCKFECFIINLRKIWSKHWLYIFDLGHGTIALTILMKQTYRNLIQVQSKQILHIGTDSCFRWPILCLLYILWKKIKEAHFFHLLFFRLDNILKQMDVKLLIKICHKESKWYSKIALWKIILIKKQKGVDWIRTMDAGVVWPICRPHAHRR